MTASRFRLFGDDLPSNAVVSRFVLREQLSTPFHAEVEFSTLDGEFAPGSTLKKSVALSVEGHQGDSRIVHGMVSEARFVRVVADRLHFSLTLRPTLWMLSQREDCRIFQNMSVVDLVQLLLDECGIADSAEWRLQGNYPEREFFIQYRESTLNFIQRLLEDAGIFYYFTHSGDGHRLHFEDVLTSLAEQEAHRLSGSPGNSLGASPLSHCFRKKQLRITEATLRDFDFKNPTAFPEASIPTENPNPQVLFEYPGNFTTSAEAEARAQTRLKSERFDADVLESTTREVGLLASSLISIEGVDEDELGGNYIVTELTSTGLQHTDEDGTVSHHTCITQLKSVPVDAIYLPERRARRPKIAGVQTAIVMGDESSDQSIFVDEFGRIKIHFHWDRRQAFDHEASCWVRVLQLPLGGSMILPRVGWEVLVAFEEGNPDRPIVLGRAYNAENMPPMALPAAKASGSLSSSSSPGGAGKNEITMGDSGGSQGFSIKAQKDLNMTTGYDQSEEVVVDDEHQVNSNLSRSVKVDDVLEVAGNQDETYGAHLSMKVTGNQTIEVGGNAMMNSTANHLESVTSDRKIVISGNHMGLNNGERFTISGQTSRTVNVADILLTASSLSHNIGSTYSSQVSGVRVHLVKGGHSEVVKGAKSETIQAGAVHKTQGDFSCESQGAIAHLVGAAVQRKINGDLTIKAPVITLTGAKGTMKGGSSKVDLSGGPIKMKGGSIVIKAAMVKITSGSLKLG